MKKVKQHYIYELAVHFIIYLPNKFYSFLRMIQRIQTVYLALAFTALMLTFVFPFAQYVIGENVYLFNIYGLSMSDAATNLVSVPFLYTIPVVALFSLVQLLLFKNRKRQIGVGRVNLIFVVALIGLLFYTTLTMGSKLSGAEVETGYGIGLFLPVVALAFIILANRGIVKDEKLVKSLDRLR